ncbi:hypothetical protein QQF64_028054 [Cirrhinus molitorella]|uniref:Uncharacterized protein n=1 Tax=Cirrhinus molitorella TaxID=172907 RepID=A0ABR3N5K9_9TELE
MVGSPLSLAGILASGQKRTRATLYKSSTADESRSTSSRRPPRKSPRIQSAVAVAAFSLDRDIGSWRSQEADSELGQLKFHSAVANQDQELLHFPAR